MPDIFDATKLKSASASVPQPVEPEYLEPGETPDMLPDPTAASTHSSIAPSPYTTIPPQDETYRVDPQAQPQPEPQEARSYDKPRREVDEYSELMRLEAPSNNPFDALAAKPLQVFFDSQDKAERVILLLRKSPITQIPWILIAFILLFMPLLFGAVGFLDFLPARFQLAGLIFWYLLITGYVLESALSWFFNVYIITDERVIDVDFLSLLYKNISSAKIENIEDITAETGGALRSVFDFGTVKIQTAGSSAEIEFEDVPQPGKVTRLLNELLLEEEREKIEGRVN